jgi:hypothetical protein
MNKQELKSDAAVRFISHNINMGKWWHDLQIMKEDWKTSERAFTRYILNSRERAMIQITKYKEANDMKRTMDIIRRVMMQIKQQNRNSETELEKQISQYQYCLGMLALEINRPVKNYKILREIMETIEETFEEGDEYLLMKAEILFEANDWRDVIMLHKKVETKREKLREQWIVRMDAIGEEIKQRKIKDRKNRLISYSNQISRNLFEKDEDINRATQLMWNRDYEEAINEACKVWTVIMITEKPEVIFAKIKVLQIMIESTLNIVLSDTKDAEGWLEIPNKLDNNGIMTSILNIKMMIRKNVEKEEIWSQYIDTIKIIGIIEDGIEKMIGTYKWKN